MNVYTLQAEHFSVPGLILRIYETKDGAEKFAQELALEMLNDTVVLGGIGSKEKKRLRLLHWDELAEWLEDRHGAAHCYIVVNEIEVRP